MTCGGRIWCSSRANFLSRRIAGWARFIDRVLAVAGSQVRWFNRPRAPLSQSSPHRFQEARFLKAVSRHSMRERFRTAFFAVLPLERSGFTGVLIIFGAPGSPSFFGLLSFIWHGPVGLAPDFSLQVRLYPSFYPWPGPSGPSHPPCPSRSS